MRNFLRNRKAVVGGIILVFFGLVAIFAPLLEPYAHNYDAFNIWQGPSSAHWLGTNGQGQDELSQLIYAARDSLVVSLLTATFISIVQLLMGIFSGYSGGATDGVLSTITNVFLVLPGLPLLIVIDAYLKQKSTFSTIAILTATGWAWGARVLRAQALSLRDRPFIEAARMSGESRWRIVTFNVVPNMFGILAANFFGAAIYALLAESGLMFIGLLNVQTTSWGGMLFWAQNDNAILEPGGWVGLIPPGVCILLLGVAFGLLNFAVDEVADPRLRRN
jgi:peptide/nickel transport system permease protein